MDVEMWPVGRLKPYPGNPRHNDTGVDAVAASLKAFGFRQPIVADEHDVIVVGHTRYKAALKLGLAEVPVHVARGLTPEQARAYRIADNQTATLSAWDDGLLAQELAALQAADFDLALTGFAEDDLLTLLADPPVAAAGDPDDVPDPPADPITRPGDLWAVGFHRLLCGDATSAADVARVLGGEAADLLLTDPPYNVAYEGGTADRLTIANDDLPVEDYQRFLTAALTAAAAHLHPGGGFYVWHADTFGLPVRTGLESAGDPQVALHGPLPRGDVIRGGYGARRGQRAGREKRPIRRSRVTQNLSFAIRPSSGRSPGSGGRGGWARTTSGWSSRARRWSG